MSDEPNSPEPMSPAELSEAAKSDEVELIDVRERYEFDAGHIEGARHIEMNALTAHADELQKDKPVVFYCRTGNRSAMATEAFAQAGYDVRNLAGGLVAWDEAGLPIAPEDGGVVAERVPPAV